MQAEIMLQGLIWLLLILGLYNNTFSITTIKQESLGGGSCFFRYIIISGEANVNVVEKERE
jgi:hypothetical protein